MNKAIAALAALPLFLGAPVFAADAPPDYFAPGRPVEAGRAVPTGPVRMTLDDAVVMCLKNNRALAVEKYNPAISKAAEPVALGRFDTLLHGEASGTSSRGQTGEAVNSATASVGAQKSDESGLTLRGDATLTTVTGNKGARTPAFDSVGATLSATKALLRGGDAAANLAAFRQAKLDTGMSAFELRGFATNLVANVEFAFWDYYLAQRGIEIVEQSFELAKAELAQTEERIRLGKLPELELSAAQAEVALRREAVIDAKSKLATAKLNLARLTGLMAEGGLDREIQLIPVDPDPAPQADDVADHVKLSAAARPEINEARLRIRRGELEVVKTKDGLLPKLDAFVTFGKTGYSDSIARAFGALDDRSYSVTVGVRGELGVQKTAEAAQARRAELTVEQGKEALLNLTELAEVDVRTAHINALRLKEQISATEATRKLREDILYFETEKHRVGRSTSLLVAGAQRDLLESRLSEVQASVSYRKALIELFRQDGSLLNRLGIRAPGDAVKEPFAE